MPENTRLRYRPGRQAADWYLTMKAAGPSLRREMASLRESPAASRILDLTRMQTLLDTFPSGGYGSPEVMSRWGYDWVRHLAVGMFIRRYDPEIAGN